MPSPWDFLNLTSHMHMQMPGFLKTFPRVLTAGGGELAKKLIDMYMTLFQLIITGKVGHAAAAQRAAEERAEAAKLAGKKGGKKKGGPGGKGGKHRQHKQKGAKAAASTQSVRWPAAMTPALLLPAAAFLQTIAVCAFASQRNPTRCPLAIPHVMSTHIQQPTSCCKCCRGTGGGGGRVNAGCGHAALL